MVKTSYNEGVQISKAMLESPDLLSMIGDEVMRRAIESERTTWERLAFAGVPSVTFPPLRAEAWPFPVIESDNIPKGTIAMVQVNSLNEVELLGKIENVKL